MIKYRPDIDGMRGIAVLIVVLFHAGLPYILGGFVGVDIFFVISGYLITSIILKDIRNNEFSFTNFYERRARRILPALYFMVCIALIVVLLIQTPKDLLKSSYSFMAALLFSSNVYFWRTTNYFSDASDLEPFLHTWSLGVEEQFYFVFPLFLLALIRHPKMLKSMVIAAFGFSFALSVYATYHYEWAGYYLLPSRAWQMMAGAIVAIYPVRLPANKSLLGGLSAMCILLLIVPAFAYTHDTRFPGVAALAPTLGATLAIVLGFNAQTNSISIFATRFLSLKPLVWLGLISYSLYLWHWPIFAFIRNYHGDVELGYPSAFIGIGLSVLFAYLSWRYVETPFRNKKVFNRKMIFSLSAGSSVAILAVGAFIILNKGLPERMDPDVIRLSSYSGTHILADDCMKLTAKDIDQDRVCKLNSQDEGKPTMAFWGDSHAGAMKRELMNFSQRYNFQGVFFANVGCPPLPGILKTNFDSGKRCLDHNGAALEYILRNDTIKTVVLHARWALSVTGTRYGNEKGPSYIIKDVNAENTISAEGNGAHINSAFQRLVKNLVAANKDIIVIGSTPEVGLNVPRVLANNVFWNKTRDIRPTVGEFLERQDETNKILAGLTSLGVKQVIDPSAMFCDKTHCQIAEDTHPLYFDDNHMSDLGASRVLALLMKAM